MSARAETPYELVSYNLMVILRRKSKKYNLCKFDFSKRQREKFEQKIRYCLRNNLFCNNPFEDENRLFLLKIEKELDGW